MRHLILSAVLALVPFSVGAQDPADPDAKDPKKEKAEFEKKVNAAIEKGVNWILAQYKNGVIQPQEEAELILLALFHGGLAKNHPFLVTNMNKVLSKNIGATYNAGVRGLLLEKVDRARYQGALAELTMWFAQSQCKNGQWSYNGQGNIGAVAGGYAPPAAKKKGPPKPGETQEADEDGPRPKKQFKLPPYKPSNTADGDNSNAQYALLGLFAAARANVEIPKIVLEKAEKWFESKQNSDGGWGYNLAGGGNPQVVTEASSGAMTTAGLTALIVTKFYQGKDWEKDEKVKKGLTWLGNNLRYDTNPGGAPMGTSLFQYYWLYGIERVGMITGLKEFGGHDWYKEGADYLLSKQADDGHWGGGEEGLISNKANTAFAILFLRQATPALQKPADVATGRSSKDDKKDEEKKDEDKKD